jgi:Cu2+-exporting ATPase
LTEDRVQFAAMRLTPAGRIRFGNSEPAALAVAAGLAAWSTHPLSTAVAEAGKLGGKAAAEMLFTEVEEATGQGLQARDAQGCIWRLGSAAWVGGGASDAVEGPVWLACSGQALAVLQFEERLRPDAAQALQALQAAGVRVTILTGDTPERAQALAARIGRVEVVAGATPEAKLQSLSAAQAAGRRVAMVGDGINDAPVLARADVSLAMGQGALVSRSQADAVITSNQLNDVVRARLSARRTVRIIRQNLAWAAAYNGVAIPLAVAGWLPPWAAGLGMAGSSLLVVLNALRAAR